ncbi:aspartate aminotransferase family protein [Streptomyces microflavus]
MSTPALPKDHPTHAHPHLAGGTAGPAALRPLIDTVLTALHDGAALRNGPPRRRTRHRHPRTRTATHPSSPTTAPAPTTPSAPSSPPSPKAPPTPPTPTAPPTSTPAPRPGGRRRPRRQRPQPLHGLLGPGPRRLRPRSRPHHRTRRRDLPPRPSPDAVITTGGTEANQLALLLARERHGPVQTLCATNAHHSIARAAWLLGLPEPVTVPAPTGTLDLAALDEALTHLHRPLSSSPPPEPPTPAPSTPRRHRRPLRHPRRRTPIDAAYGGPLSSAPPTAPPPRPPPRPQRHPRPPQTRLATRIRRPLRRPRTPPPHPLHHHAPYLNADDDTEAGLPDLLGRSLRTTRRPDALKIAVTLQALGRTGLADLIDRTLATAHHLADLITKTPTLDLYDRPTISTVLFRPTGTDDHTVATLRRTLLNRGHAVLGRAHAEGRLWLKATLLNPTPPPKTSRHSSTWSPPPPST